MKTDDRELQDLRMSYEQGHLDETEVACDPFSQFRQWFDEALEKGLFEPNAMTLATVDGRGRPACRPVLIKGFDEQGIVWYSNYDSRKGQELAQTPFAALQFYWAELERVIRIEGAVEKVSAELSDAYYDSRPLSHRIGAWASPQSQVIDGRRQIIQSAFHYGAKFGLKPPRPPHWGGYLLKPDYWEFWQGRPSRLHDRIVYRPHDQGGWQRQRLAP
jgi:pyridoxamine 5'-phosphate oxidase